ncbi:MAG TPA: PTS sugar transporter subunit IIA [Spirochaetia bacterium]|nr:PTS sugar transporter subunit IIA [Spirochaetia bacterium]
MNLKIRDVAGMLHVSEKTIYRWIKEKRIPVYQINHQYRFSADEIRDWMSRNRVDAAGDNGVVEEAEERLSISELLQRGGIFYKVEGDNVRDVIWNAVAIIPSPPEIPKETIAEAIYSRERMMNTAMGNGVAAPHARTPLIRSGKDENLSICFLDQPIDFGSLDGEPVHSIFIPLTASVQQHLEVLSKITFLCRQDEFMGLLRAQVARRELIAYVESRESTWEVN